MKTLPPGALLCAFFFAPTISILAQGSLTPPAAPTPTMKTLDQLEPRIPIDATHTPGDSGALFKITQPGSYYLTGNLTGVSGKHGISINADDVTIDLNGFALLGGASGFGSSGIFVPAAQKNLRIHNGSAQSWGGSGVSCALASNSLFDHLRLSQNTLDGLTCGIGCVISNCSAETNTTDGINVGDSCTVTASTAVSNGSNGFSPGNHCTIIACTASSNSFVGIFPSDYCTIKDCVASMNSSAGIRLFTNSRIEGCIVTENGGNGMNVGDHNTVTRCAANGNHLNGILFGGDCRITDNLASTNSGDGFHATGSGNRIDGNQARQNTGTGIDGNVNDVIVRNSAGGNGTDYTPSSGTNFGQVQSPSVATNPMANIVF